MMIHEITEKVGKNRKRKRIGRGHGSGQGKQAGRGHKGAGSRRGHSTRFQFEGGQMPYFRRMPKLGFSNVQFLQHIWLVNLRDLLASVPAGTPQRPRAQRSSSWPFSSCSLSRLGGGWRLSLK